jgi:hypothetical protein
MTWPMSGTHLLGTEPLCEAHVTILLLARRMLRLACVTMHLRTAYTLGFKEKTRTVAVAGHALIEIIVAVTILAVTVVGGTQALLKANRSAAISRVTNMAKAKVLSRTQQLSQLAFKPEANPPVIPALLSLGTKTETVNLGNEATDLGNIPGTITWTVAQATGAPNVRSIRCKVTYQYLGRDLSYELFTYKSAD